MDPLSPQLPVSPSSPQPLAASAPDSYPPASVTPAATGPQPPAAAAPIAQTGMFAGQQTVDYQKSVVWKIVAAKEG